MPILRVLSCFYEYVWFYKHFSIITWSLCIKCNKKSEYSGFSCLTHTIKICIWKYCCVFGAVLFNSPGSISSKIQFQNFQKHRIKLQMRFQQYPSSNFSDADLAPAPNLTPRICCRNPDIFFQIFFIFLDLNGLFWPLITVALS